MSSTEIVVAVAVAGFARHRPRRSAALAALRVAPPYRALAATRDDSRAPCSTAQAAHCHRCHSLRQRSWPESDPTCVDRRESLPTCANARGRARQPKRAFNRAHKKKHKHRHRQISEQQQPILDNSKREPAQFGVDGVKFIVCAFKKNDNNKSRRLSGVHKTNQSARAQRTSGRARASRAEPRRAR